MILVYKFRCAVCLVSINSSFINGVSSIRTFTFIIVLSIDNIVLLYLLILYLENLYRFHNVLIDYLVYLSFQLDLVEFVEIE